MNEVKVSVITVCFNSEKHIERSIQSTFSQTYPNIELIIVDGKSTDTTMQTINRYKEKISLIISEPDEGIYDAMNKGVHKSSGGILYFLNSDDVFFDSNVVADIVDEFKKHPSSEIIYGQIKYVNIPKELLLTLQRIQFEYKSRLNLYINRVVPQQCFFSKKSVFDKVGIFNKRYAIYGDYDWLLRSFNQGINIRYADRLVALFNTQGLSYQKRYAAILEKMEVVYKNSNFFHFLIYLLWSIIVGAYEFFLEHVVSVFYASPGQVR